MLVESREGSGSTSIFLFLLLTVDLNYTDGREKSTSSYWITIKYSQLIWKTLNFILASDFELTVSFWNRTNINIAVFKKVNHGWNKLQSPLFINCVLQMAIKEIGQHYYATIPLSSIQYSLVHAWWEHTSQREFHFDLKLLCMSLWAHFSLKTLDIVVRITFQKEFMRK